MSHPDPLDPLRRLLALHAAAAPQEPTLECPDDDTLAALAEGSLGAAARAAALGHVASCPRCRSIVASVARALADPGVAREVASPRVAGRRRFYRIALPAAAAAVLLVLAWPRHGDEGRSPPHRSPPGATAVPVPRAPAGVVAQAETLRWTPVAGADRYRVTLFDSGGRVLFETQLADTLAALPDSILLDPGRPYLWKVEARTGWQRWSASGLVEFSIAGGPPP